MYKLKASILACLMMSMFIYTHYAPSYSATLSVSPKKHSAFFQTLATMVSEKENSARALEKATNVQAPEEIRTGAHHRKKQQDLQTPVIVEEIPTSTMAIQKYMPLQATMTTPTLVSFTKGESPLIPPMEVEQLMTIPDGNHLQRVESTITLHRSNHIIGKQLLTFPVPSDINLSANVQSEVKEITSLTNDESSEPRTATSHVLTVNAIYSATVENHPYHVHITITSPTHELEPFPLTPIMTIEELNYKIPALFKVTTEETKSPVQYTFYGAHESLYAGKTTYLGFDELTSRHQYKTIVIGERNHQQITVTVMSDQKEEGRDFAYTVATLAALKDM